MECLRFNQFKASAETSHVLFFYSGEFTRNVVTTAADMLKHRIAEQNPSNSVKRKLFSTFIEMSQNILHYAMPELECEEPECQKNNDTPSTGNGKGCIAVGWQDDYYWIICSNRIDTAVVPRLTERLEAVRSMTLEEIKLAYKEQLKNSDHKLTDTVSKGAGLGLLTIARDISAPLEYVLSSPYLDNNQSSVTDLQIMVRI